MELRILELTSRLRDCETYLKVISGNAGLALRLTKSALDKDGVAVESIGEEGGNRA